MLATNDTQTNALNKRNSNNRGNGWQRAPRATAIPFRAPASQTDHPPHMIHRNQFHQMDTNSVAVKWTQPINLHHMDTEIMTLVQLDPEMLFPSNGSPNSVLLLIFFYLHPLGLHEAVHTLSHN